MMNEIKRYYISRAEFIKQFGLIPRGDVIGVCFTNPEGTAILAEYVFTDDGPSADVAAGSRADIAELDRIYSLSE
jgi:hypothetical protein